MRIQKDEKQDIEFKQAWRDEYLKQVCAFANSSGGTLYIGVRDDGEVCGVEEAHKLSEDIPNKILSTMDLICPVDMLPDGDKSYFQIRVEKYPFPVSYRGKYYKRSGSTTQELTGYELDKMILAVQGRTWDSVPVPHVGAEELDEESFRMFRQKALQRHRLSEEDLAVSREDLLHNLHCYEGITRRETYFFPPDAFRELLLNAVIHKDYMQPTPVQIQVFRDRINIWNFGEMPSSVPVESLFKAHRSVPRNPNLASIFFRCGYVESWGRGYSKIQRICREWNAEMPRPELNTGGLAVDCVASSFYRELAGKLKVDGFDDVAQDDAQSVAQTEQELPNKLPNKLSEAVRNTLSVISADPAVTGRELAERLDVSDRTIREHIKILKEAGLLAREGSNKSGCWKLLFTEGSL